MELYSEITIKHSDGSEELIRGNKGYSIERVYEDFDGYDGFNHTICRLDLPVYKIMYYKGNTRYEVTHTGEYIIRAFRANIWWVEFKAGDKWEKASGYHDKLEGALRALGDLEASTEGFSYRIDGGMLGEKLAV